MLDYTKAYIGEEPVCGAQQWMINTNFLQKKSGSVGEKFDGKEYPVVALNFQTVIHLYVSDPELAQDIFIGKNGMHDKDSEGLLMF